MNIQTRLLHTHMALAACAGGPQAVAQGAVFTYQGQLNDGADPASGSYDLTFALFDADIGGTQQGNTLTNLATAVGGGLFTVTLDFGNQFPGAERWLEIGVRTNGDGTLSVLSPRQPVTPTPYAIYPSGASAAGLSGTLPSASLARTYSNAVSLSNPSNQLSGIGLDLIALDASQLTSGTVPDARLSGDVARRTGGNNFSGSQTIAGNAFLEFGAGIADKDSAASRIAYQLYSTTGLDIVGAGTNNPAPFPLRCRRGSTALFKPRLNSPNKPRPQSCT